MTPLIALALKLVPLVGGLIPEVITALGGSRAAEAASVMIEAAKTVTGDVTSEGAVEKMLAKDSDKLLQFQQIMSVERTKLAEFAAQSRHDQVETNKVEIATGGFLSKWRSVLGMGLAFSAIYQLMVHPLFIAIILWVTPTFPVEKLPKLDWKELGSLLAGLLGIGA